MVAQAAAGCMLVQWVAFVILWPWVTIGMTHTAVVTTTHLFMHITLIAVTAFTLFERGDAASRRQLVASGLVAVWATSKVLFVVYWALSGLLDELPSLRRPARNPLFTVFKSAWVFFAVCCFLGAFIFFTTMPVYVLNSIDDRTPLGVQDYVGIGIWALGFLIAVTAHCPGSPGGR